MLALEGKLKKTSERLIAIDLFGKESVEGKWHDSAPGARRRAAARGPIQWGRITEADHVTNLRPR